MSRLMSFLRHGFSQSSKILGEEKNLTYQNKTIKGIYNEREESSELDIGGRNIERECTFQIEQAVLEAADITIQKNKKCKLDGLNWKITGIITGPVSTTLTLTNPNNSKYP